MHQVSATIPLSCERGRSFCQSWAGICEGLRESRGWNQLQTVDMARRRRVTLSYNTLRWIEDGKIKNPEPEALKAMSVLYGVSYEDLVSSYARERFGFQRGFELGARVSQGLHCRTGTVDSALASECACHRTERGRR